MRRAHLLVPLLLLLGCSSTPPSPATAPAATTAAAATTATKYADKINVQVDACAHLGQGDSRAEVLTKLQDSWNVTEAEANTAIDKAVAADGLCSYNRAAASR